MPRIRSTTILCVRRDGKVVMAGDGQVTMGQEVLKASAKKLRRLYKERLSPASPARRPTHFRFSRASKASSSSTTVICREVSWSLRRIGARTKCCGIWTRCCW